MAQPRSAKKSKGPKVQHVFRNVREASVVDASAASPGVANISTDGTGQASGYIVISPLGIGYPVFTSSSATGPITVARANLQSPRLPWLYNTSRNFERYRITRCVAIFVGNTSANTTGTLGVATTTDYADYINNVTLATTSGGKTFPIAQTGSKDLRIQCDIDSSWKKVSSSTYATLTGVGGSFIPTNTVNDLMVTFLSYSIVGATAGATVGQFSFEYDVEFRDPISYGQNN